MAKRFVGRGTHSNPAGRFDRTQAQAADDGWGLDPADSMPDSIATSVLPERSKSILTRNDSPDIPFEQSINPYRGCEHGCPYCYARPSHSFVGLSPGLDFETRLFYKSDAANLLRRELARPGYRCSPIMLGANTDPYQPAEKRLRVTRSILEVLVETRHPAMLITKGALLERDLDLLADLARDRLVTVTFSLPTLDVALKRILEPRAASPQARLRLMQQCASRGIPVSVMVAPVIPVLTDPQIERVLEASAAAGASRANFIMLRLPHEVAGLFGDWLREHFPDRAAHVMARVHEMRGGRANDPCFGTRMSGVGEWAGMIRQRFAVACRRLQLSQSRGLPLDTAQFRAPRVASAAPSCGQLPLEL